MLFENDVQPIEVVNGYIWSVLTEMEPALLASNMWPKAKYPQGPFFPINDSASGISQWKDRPYFVYNKAFRVEHLMYEHKKETFVYSLRANVDEVFAIAGALQKIIDRQDDAAADINEFNRSTQNDRYCPVVFHSLEMYQNEPSDPRDSSSSPYTVTNFQVVVKYHRIDSAPGSVFEPSQGGTMWDVTGGDFPPEAEIGDLGFDFNTGDVWRNE